MASFPDKIRDGFRWIGPVLISRSFWLAMFGLVAIGGFFMVLLNFAIMPLWTRHDAAVTVPEVRQLPAEQAADVLERAGLRAEMREQPYNPNIDADIVVDQTPLPSASVKPGRRIYYYVNVAPREMVTVPDVVSMAEGRAKPDLIDAGLLIGDIRTDTVRTPFEGTVTRQTPPGGSAVPKGTRITLWLSPGLGRNQIRVPDVTGLLPEEARRALREAGLWVNSPEARTDTVQWQKPKGGNRLREGSEVEIYTTEPPENWNAPPTPPREPTADPEEEMEPGDDESETPEPAEPVGQQPPPVQPQPIPQPIPPAPVEQPPLPAPADQPPPPSDDGGNDDGDGDGEDGGGTSLL